MTPCNCSPIVWLGFVRRALVSFLPERASIHLAAGVLGLFLMLLAVPVSVVAQTVPINPTEIAFSSPDHAIVTDYEVGYFLAGATVPVQSQKVAKPALNADGDVHLTTNSRPLALGQYEIKVRAYVGTVTTPWAGGGPAGDQSVPFARALSLLGNLRVVR